MMRTLALLASFVAVGAQDAPAGCEGDINSDGLVNVQDLLSLLAQFGSPVTAEITADINGVDDLVNVLDLLLMLGAFGTTDCPAGGVAGTPWSGEVARLSFEEADAHLNAANGHIYIDFGDDYSNRIESTIAPHELANAGQFNPVSYAACSRGTAEVGFRTFFDGANANTDSGGRWNIDSNLLWYWNHAYIRAGTCNNCETDPTVDTGAGSTDIPMSPGGVPVEGVEGGGLKFRESCDWDNNADTDSDWADSYPSISRDDATGGIRVEGLCAGGATTDYDGDQVAGGAVYVPNGEFNGKPRYTLYYNGHTMEIFWAPQNWGSADGDRMGVIGDDTTAQGGGGGGVAPDGSQYYMMEDTDGLAHVETDEIALTGLTTVSLDVDLHIESTGWEANDMIQIWAEDSGDAPDVTLLVVQDIDEFTENEWVHYTADLSGFTGVTVKFSMSSNSGAEEMWIDNIVITGEGSTPGGVNPAALNCPDQNVVVLGQTSFEEPVRAVSKADGKYYDTLCSVVDGQNSVCDVPHYMINNEGQNPVAYTGVGTEMGFNSYFEPTRALLDNVVGLADGDDFGVVGDHSTDFGNTGGGNAPDGVQYLMMEDTDGQVTFTFDTVLLTGVISATASVMIHIESTSWESADVFQVWCENVDGRRAYLFSDFDMDSHVENEWQLHEDILPSDFDTCTLTISFDSNAASEEAWVDMVKIEANVPADFVVPALIPVVTTSAASDCIMDGMDYGGGGACGFAPVITIIADHADWAAPGWYAGVVLRDETMTSPEQCQVLCQADALCEFFSYEWEFTGADYYHECYLKERDTCRDGTPDEYVPWASEDPAWNGASGPAVCPPPSPPAVSYAYTSFEEPLAPNCPGLSQGNCDATFDGTAAECATGAGCPYPNLGIDAHDNYQALVDAGTVDGSARYVTNYVAGTNGAAELGFETFYLACGEASLAVTGVACDYDAQNDNDNNGVIAMSNSGPSNTPPTGSFNAWGAAAGNAGGAMPEGDQCFMIDDSDGFVYVVLDPVDLSLFTSPTVSAWTHIDSTGYEAKDAIRVWAECSGGATVDIVSGVLDDEAHPVGASGDAVTENAWIPHIAALPADCGTVTVKFGCQTNSNSEECWFDMIEIVESGGHNTGPAPPPPPPPPPPPAPVSPAPAVVGATYQYTSFEEPLSVNTNDCPEDPATSQGQCENIGMATIGAVCGADGAPVPCPIPSQAGIESEGEPDTQVPARGGWVTAFASTGNELGFTSYWEACTGDGGPAAVQIGPGYCSDWRYLPEGGYPARLDAADPLADPDPVTECMNRCVAATGQNTIQDLAFYVKNDGGDQLCACSSGQCTTQAGSDTYMSYSITHPSTTGVGCDYTPNDDGDQMGVMTLGRWGSAGDNGNDVLHGSQVYMIDDPDGFAYVTLDPVDLSGMTTPVVSIWTHIDSTGYESKDAIRVWATCSGGATIDIISGVLDDEAHPTGADGQQLAENLWIPHMASLAGCGTATLSFGCQTNSGSEECWFDLIEFYDAIPDPNVGSPTYSGIGSGYCSDWTYLPEGGYPARLADTEPLYDADPLQECMNRCLSAAGEATGISDQAFYVRDGELCSCASGACETQAGGSNYHSYSIDPPAASPTYAYTSFEEPSGPDCPALGQGDCIAAFDGTAADCATGDGCAMPASMPIDLRPDDVEFAAAVAGGWDPAGAAYTTGYTAGTNGAAELGFQTYYVACGEAALALTGAACDYAQSDSDNNGVISMTNSGPGNQPPAPYNAWGAAAGNAGGAMPHGDNCYMIDDPDGFVYVALDPVDLTAYTSATVSAWTHIDSTSYEDSDAIRVWAECSGGATVDIVSGVLDDAAHPTGADGQQVTENAWIPHIAALPADCGTVTVKFGCQMNANGEECWFDMIEIVESGGHHTVPDPCEGVTCQNGGVCNAMGECDCVDLFSGAMCEVPPPAPENPAAPGGRTVGPTYQYTSFEQAASVDCIIGTSQNDCANAATITLRADCAADGAPVPCPIPSLAGIASGNTAADPLAGAGYVTAFESTGDELGFATYWEPCVGDDPTTAGVACNFDGDDRDNLGVVIANEWGAGGDNGADVLHGNNVYMIDDPDGFAYVTLDPVDLAAMATPVVSIWTHIDSTGYEDSDAIRVWATCADGTTIIDVVSGVLDDEAHPTGADGQQLAENVWVPHIASLAGCGTATLSFGCQSNSNGEECWFDVIEFYDAAGGGGGTGPSGPNVVISELMYNPAGSMGPDSDFEYTELYNSGDAVADIGEWTLAGHNIQFPVGTTIAAGEYIIICRNVDAITPLVPAGTQVFLRDGGGLGNNNEDVILSNGADVIDSAHYDDNGDRGGCGTWSNVADGNGGSLERVIVDGVAADGNCGDSWTPSCNTGPDLHGTPGGPGC